MVPQCTYCARQVHSFDKLAGRIGQGYGSTDRAYVEYVRYATREGDQDLSVVRDPKGLKKHA
jgi:hypothetical protein